MDFEKQDHKTFSVYTYNKTTREKLINVITFTNLGLKYTSNLALHYILYSTIQYIEYCDTRIRFFVSVKGHPVQLWICEIYASLDEFNWFVRNVEMRGAEMNPQELRIIALEQKLSAMVNILEQRGF